MTDMEAIYARHSVRKYQDRKLEADKAARIRELLDSLNADFDLHMQLIEDAGSVFSGLASKLTGWSGVTAYIAVAGRIRDDLE